MDGRVGNHLILPIYLLDGTRAESTGQGRGIADNVAKCLRSLRSVKIFAQTLFGKLACYGFKVIYRPRGEIRRKEFVLQSVQTVEHKKILTNTSIHPQRFPSPVQFGK